MNLTNDEITDLMDCINNRIDFLTDYAMFGDGEEIEAEVERLNRLIKKMGEALEAQDGH